MVSGSPLPCCHSSSLDPIEYYGSDYWCCVLEKLMEKYKCPGHLVPAPPKDPEEV